MKIGKSRDFRKWLLLGTATLALLLIFGFFYFDPRHPAYVTAFKALYLTSFNKQLFLTFYSPLRRDVSGGYIPSEVDDFLCERAESANDSEIRAIADFYSLQAHGRQGGCIYLVSDRTAERMVGYLVAKIEDKSNADVAGEISILEQIRTRTSLGKGGLNSRENVNRPNTAEEWANWKNSVAIPIARQRYADWWDSSGTWEEKRKIFPLEGTPVTVSSCCG